MPFDWSLPNLGPSDQSKIEDLLADRCSSKPSSERWSNRGCMGLESTLFGTCLLSLADLGDQSISSSPSTSIMLGSSGSSGSSSEKRRVVGGEEFKTAKSR